MTRLYVIRGNSGAGKTTVARALRAALERDGNTVTLVEQDPLRSVSDRAVDLIRDAAESALARGDVVIVEGILNAPKYRSMLSELMSHAGDARAFYLDVSFEETLRRHATRSNAAQFGEAEMRDWWRERDVLGAAGETIVSERSTLEETVALLVDSL